LLPSRQEEARIARTSALKLFETLPIVVYAFFAVRYIASNDMPALQLIALFSMGIPAFVALIQLCLNRTVVPALSSSAC
jgi:putative membrane protein